LQGSDWWLRDNNHPDGTKLQLLDSRRN
jgi:hypothetical protein